MDSLRVAAFIAATPLIANCGGSPATPSRNVDVAPSFLQGATAASGGWANAVRLTSGLSGGVPWETLTTNRRIVAVTADALATAPVNLVGTSAGSTVTLAWTPGGSEAALAYIVEAGSRAGLADLANFDTGSPAVSFTATGVPPGTYYVRVRMRAASSVSGPSNEIALVVSGSSCSIAPGAPDGLSSSATGSAVTLRWNAPAVGCAATGYTVEVGSSPGAGNLATVPTGSPATTFSASGVVNGTYYLRVRATNAFGASGPSNESTLTVGASTGGFTVDMPVAAADPQNNAYGLWPFGVHGSSHAADGHPGWDVEVRPGANILAAADGTVGSVFPENAQVNSIRIQHSVGGAAYATDYTNVASVRPDIVPGARVTRGQVLGAAGVLSQYIGSTPVTWAMTHFQVNDFSRSEGLTNPNAVPPEWYLSASGRTIFESIWRTAAYRTEWCEPFSINSRLATFPATRSWRLHSGGSQISIIDIRCVSASTNQITYSLWSGGAIIESGTFDVEANKKPVSFVDFTPASGASRLGVWDIYNETLQLNLGAPGAPRPSSLAGAPVYTTTR